MIEKLIAKQRGNRLKIELKLRGITQKEAAKILYISLSGLTYLLSGRSMISPVLAYAIEFKMDISSEYILNGTEQRDNEIKDEVITEKQYENMMRELAEIKEKLWPQESQQQLVETLTELNNVMAQQTQIAEKQSEVLLQLDKYLEEEEEPEPMVS
jgi:transcriptional regulator with XRE-family HTH domain